MELKDGEIWRRWVEAETVRYKKSKKQKKQEASGKGQNEKDEL